VGEDGVAGAHGENVPAHDRDALRKGTQGVAGPRARPQDDQVGVLRGGEGGEERDDERE
jgi:hypothetical protein